MKTLPAAQVLTSASSRFAWLLNATMQIIGGLLVILGLLKIFGLFEANPYLALHNPILPFVTNRVVIAMSALAEVLVGLSALRRSYSEYAPWLVMWLTLVMVTYKFLLALVGYKGPCGCLLGLTSLLPMSPKLQRSMAELLLLIMGLVSFATLLNRYIRSRSARRVDAGQSPDLLIPREPAN
jgi:hypothetical protein